MAEILPKRLPEWVSNFIPIAITASLTWVGSYFTNQQSQAVRNERIDNQIGQIKSWIDDMKRSMEESTRYRYTGDDAKRDQLIIMESLAMQSRRNDAQDTSIAKLTENQQRLLVFMAAAESAKHKE